MLHEWGQFSEPHKTAVSRLEFNILSTKVIIMATATQECSFAVDIMDECVK